MKKMKMAIALCLALLLCLNIFVSVSAAQAHDALTDEAAKASLTLWKYDWTNACKDGVWNEDSFTSTGWSESYVEEMLETAVREGDANGETDNPMGNGQNSNGYAIQGVGFTIAKVANIVTYSEAANDQHPDYNTTFVLYGFHKEKAVELLAAIGLYDGEGRYEFADDVYADDYWYYRSDALNKALADALSANETKVKNALEAYMAANMRPNLGRIYSYITGGSLMPEIRQRDPNDIIKTKGKRQWSVGTRIDDAVREKVREHRNKKEEANEYATGVTEEEVADAAIKVRHLPDDIKRTVQQLQPKTKERVLNEPEEPHSTVEQQRQLAVQKAREQTDNQEDSQCSTDSTRAEKRGTETPSYPQYSQSASQKEPPSQNSSNTDIKEKPKGDNAPKQRPQQEPKTRSRTEQVSHTNT